MRLVFLISFLSLSLGLSTFVGCSGNKGELVGIRVKKWYSDKPYGMSLVKGGTFIMGKTNDDNAGVSNSPTKQVAVTSFYMDETEITNGEYRQFVEWVRDSVVRTMLAEKAKELEKDSKNDKKGIGQYSYVSKDSTKMSAYEKYMLENYPDIIGNQLNNEIDIVWDPSDYPDVDYASVMDSIYLPIDDAYDGVRIIDVKNLNYLFQWLDILEAANSDLDNRKDFIKKEIVNIFPDTLVWIKDFNYSYNEPLHNKYFSHSAYIDYPVVGVTWDQARAFCSWRTFMKNDYQKLIGDPFVNNFRLPTEAEWEYAARGGIEAGKYPWGGPYIINDKACYLANFKPQRGDYASDENLYTAEARSYEPNGYNLYNMSGNVSEWTNSSYYANSYDFFAEINPNALRGEHKRRVVRGGSWKDIAYFLEVSTRDFEYSDSARSYIGFRTVQDYLGKE